MKALTIITMETGAILAVKTEGDDRQHCEGLAIAAAQSRFDGQVWDTCNAPWFGNDCPHLDGVTVLYAPKAAP